MGTQMAVDLTPRKVARVQTKYRRIVTDIPVPESIPILERLRQFEPRSMSGQPPVVWDRAEGIQVYDRWGNMWLDWSSGVLVTNAGHGHPAIRQAIIDQVEHGLMHNYCFPSEIRAELAAKLAQVAPEGLKKVFLLTTGAEACECAIKLARTHGKAHRRQEDRDRHLPERLPRPHAGLADGRRHPGPEGLDRQPRPGHGPGAVPRRLPRPGHELRGLPQGPGPGRASSPTQVAGVMSETYQGGNASFAPPEYVQKLRAWCDKHQVLLIFDEVQAGFGRTGTYWGFEHYGVVPDLICCGKGISSGLPLSAVIGRSDDHGPLSARLDDLDPHGQSRSVRPRPWPTSR